MWALLANHESLSYFQAYASRVRKIARKMADEEDFVVIDEQPESQKGEKKK